MISLSRCLAQPVPTDRPCAHLLFQVAKGRYHSARELLTEWRQMDLKHVAIVSHTNSILQLLGSACMAS